MTQNSQEAWQLAQDASTPAAVLFELAQSHPEVHPALAANPATYPDLLGWLSRLGNPEVDRALAARQASPATPGVDNAPQAATPERDPGAQPARTSILGRPAVVTPPGQPPAVSPGAQPAAPPAAAPVFIPPSQLGATQQVSPQSAAAPPAIQPTQPGGPAAAPVFIPPSHLGAASPAVPPVIPPAHQAPANQALSHPAPSPQSSHTQQAAPTRLVPAVPHYPQYGPSYTHAPQRPSGQRRKAPYIVIALLTVTVLVLGILLALNVFGKKSETPVQPPLQAGPSRSAPETLAPTAPPSATTSPQGLESARAQLEQFIRNTACDRLPETAAAFRTFEVAVKSLPDSHEAKATALRRAFATLQQTCNAYSALTVSDAIKEKGTDFPEIYNSRDWVTPKVPAPSGAIDAVGFSAPSGNIVCTMSADGVKCTIRSYAFTPPNGCTAGQPVTMRAEGATAFADCSVPPLSNTFESLPYGSAAKSGDYVCTSNLSGIRCWNVLSGSGFNLRREDLTTIPQVFGN